MQQKKHPFFGLFFGLILISIPIFNQLHFSLIDHSTTIDKSNKEVIHHQCSHFTYFVMFLDTHDEIEIEEIYENGINSEICSKIVEFQTDSTIDFRFTRGPPNINLLAKSTKI